MTSRRASDIMLNERPSLAKVMTAAALPKRTSKVETISAVTDNSRRGKNGMA